MAAKKNKRRKLLVFLVLGLVLLGLGAWVSMNRKEGPIAVQVETVQRRSITEVVVANGRIHPVTQVVINPEVSGEIIELAVREGQLVEKGDLLLRIRPDNYIASRQSAEAAHQAAIAGMTLAQANVDKAELDFKRTQRLFDGRLISDSDLLAAETNLKVARATFDSSVHHSHQAKAALDRAVDDLSKTTILSPLSGTITSLKSQVGERVVGSITMPGTEIMTIAELNEMEARVDIGEVDIVLLAIGQKANLEVDAYRDRKFTGLVTDIANSAKGGPPTGQQQEAIRFEVKIRIQEKELFRPGMSVTAEIETRSREKVIAVPIQSVTTRMPASAPTEPPPEADPGKQAAAAPVRPVEVVFVADNGRARMIPVTRGISDDSYVELLDGPAEGAKVVSGGYRAINRDLQEAKPIRID
jgi:HlyD family secretion protein